MSRDKRVSGDLGKCCRLGITLPCVQTADWCISRYIYTIYIMYLE